jgi:hypothetical protein
MTERFTRHKSIIPIIPHHPVTAVFPQAVYGAIIHHPARPP